MSNIEEKSCPCGDTHSLDVAIAFTNPWPPWKRVFYLLESEFRLSKLPSPCFSFSDLMVSSDTLGIIIVLEILGLNLAQY
jgi:hypothetical protein